MFDFTRPQWCKLSRAPTKIQSLLYEEIASNLETTKQDVVNRKDKIIYLSKLAWPIYEAASTTYHNNWGKPNNGRPSRARALGFAGNDAILATLNSRRLFYQTNQLYALYSDRIDYDFVLWPNQPKIEVKTTDANGRYSNSCNINKNRWHKGKEPDIIISLRGSIIEDYIVLEFMGWVFAKEVREPRFRFIKMTQEGQSFYTSNFVNLHPPTDIEDFLFGLAHEGPSYLDRLSK